MSPNSLALVAAAVALAATGCVPRTTLYHWRGYDDGLYRHYKNPQDREHWVETLKVIMLESEEQGLKVPPGVHAEYGFALYEEGRFPEAITYFDRERAEWPESRVLMEKMVRNAQGRAAQRGPASLAPAATGAAGALETTR